MDCPKLYLCESGCRDAERFGLTPRTFGRRFRSATGYLPIDYVHALRVEEAKQIIETETRSIDEVGYDVGYEDPTFFRRLFKRKTGLTPAAYRRKFAGILEMDYVMAADAFQAQL